MRFFKSWKSSAAGILGLLTIATAAVQDPGELIKPQTITGILTCVGLLFAKDFNISGAPPRDRV